MKQAKLRMIVIRRESTGSSDERYLQGDDDQLCSKGDVGYPNGQPSCRHHMSCR